MAIIFSSAISPTCETVHADNGLITVTSFLLAKACGLVFSFCSRCRLCVFLLCIEASLDYLQTGKADMMLAGAVSASDPMFVNMGFSIFKAYPGNNISAPLDTRSQGLLLEGAGMMLLKRHSDAVRDGDHIHAIIKGAALSNDGKGEFVLSPNTKGQCLFMSVPMMMPISALMRCLTSSATQPVPQKAIRLNLAQWKLSSREQTVSL